MSKERKFNRKKSPEQEIKQYAAQIVHESKDWEYINKNGCNDPNWPDGENMNLVRNHILYFKNEIFEICVKNDIALPDAYFVPTPPEVDSYYMANLTQKERVKHLRRLGDKLTRGQNKFDNQQMKIDI
jgi:hypothetical protein